jgi:hypothetical protein
MRPSLFQDLLPELVRHEICEKRLDAMSARCLRLTCRAALVVVPATRGPTASLILRDWGTREQLDRFGYMTYAPNYFNSRSEAPPMSVAAVSWSIDRALACTNGLFTDARLFGNLMIAGLYGAAHDEVVITFKRLRDIIFAAKVRNSRPISEGDEHKWDYSLPMLFAIETSHVSLLDYLFSRLERAHLGVTALASSHGIIANSDRAAVRRQKYYILLPIIRERRLEIWRVADARFIRRFIERAGARWAPTDPDAEQREIDAVCVQMIYRESFESLDVLRLACSVYGQRRILDALHDALGSCHSISVADFASETLTMSRDRTPWLEFIAAHRIWEPDPTCEMALRFFVKTSVHDKRGIDMVRYFIRHSPDAPFFLQRRPDLLAKVIQCAFDICSIELVEWLLAQPAVFTRDTLWHYMRSTLAAWSASTRYNEASQDAFYAYLSGLFAPGEILVSAPDMQVYFCFGSMSPGHLLFLFQHGHRSFRSDTDESRLYYRAVLQCCIERLRLDARATASALAQNAVAPAYLDDARRPRLEPLVAEVLGLAYDAPVDIPGWYTLFICASEPLAARVLSLLARESVPDSPLKEFVANVMCSNDGAAKSLLFVRHVAVSITTHTAVFRIYLDGVRDRLARMGHTWREAHLEALARAYPSAFYRDDVGVAAEATDAHTFAVEEADK